jgi:HSP20 family protein
MANNLQKWLGTQGWNPFRELTQAGDSMERLMNEMLAARKSQGDIANFAPNCDIEEDGNKYVLKFDLPGVSKDQVKVEVNGDQLTVRAERKQEKKSESKKTYLSEIYYGSYMRSFTLPSTVAEKDVDAKFENGVLTVTVPKTEASKIKQIPVQ